MIKADQYDEEYWVGYSAYTHGLPMCDNLHPSKTVSREAWNEGWKDARKDNQQAAVERG